MEFNHKKRFTHPLPSMSLFKELNLDAMVAKLPQLPDGTSLQQDFAALYESINAWLMQSQQQAQLLFPSDKPPMEPRPTGRPNESLDGKIQVLMESGQLAKAKRAARQILKAVNVKEALAEEARSEHGSGPVTFALKSLALISHVQGDNEKAEKAYRMLVRIYSANAGQDSAATLQYKYSLAEFYADEEPDKAMKLLVQVIASCNRLGANKSAIYADANSLAGALEIQDDDPKELDRAAGYLAEAEAVQTHACETDSAAWRALALTIARLARLAQARGDDEEASRQFERAIKLHRDNCGEESSESIMVLAGLLMEYGQHLFGLGENAEAIRVGKEGVQLIRMQFGPLSVEIIPFLMSLGHLYRLTRTEQGAEKACRLLKKVVVLHEQHFRSPEDYLAEATNLLEAHKGIIVACITLKAYEKADEWADRTMRVIADLDDSADSAVELIHLYEIRASICELDGRPEDARGYEKLAKEVLESLQGQENEEDEETDEDDDEDEDDQWWRGGRQTDDDEG